MVRRGKRDMHLKYACSWPFDEGKTKMATLALSKWERWKRKDRWAV